MVQQLNISWKKTVAVVLFLISILEANSCTRQWMEQSGHLLNCSFKARSTEQLISEGKFWSKYVEEYVEEKRTKTPSFLPPDTRFEAVQYDKCGRMKNKLLISNKGIKYCARYRDNVEQLQGEYYSYIISSMLSMNNVLPVFLLEVNPNSHIWSAIWPILEKSGWHPHKVVGITQWIDSVRPVKAPKYITDQDPRRCQVSCDDLGSLTLIEAGFLMQWSDLIVFDYITGNIDRLISHLHSLQWDGGALHLPVHNLVQSESGHLLFLDNELGLDHSYRLMSQYGHHHEQLLRQICVFRKSVTEGLKLLSDMHIDMFENLLQDLSPIKLLFPYLNYSNVKALKERILKAFAHVNKSCFC